MPNKKKQDRTKIDEALELIGEYVAHTPITSKEAYETARYCLADSMGCAILALRFPNAQSY